MGTYAMSKEIKQISPIKEDDIIENGEVKLIMVVREDKTWAAYQGKSNENFHYILANGKPLAKNLACWFFYNVAQRNLEYRP